MASWKITTASGKTYPSSLIPASTYNAVSEILDNAGWSTLEPTVGPRQLIAWVAILEALESDDKDVMTHLVDVMSRPMIDVMRTFEVTE